MSPIPESELAAIEARAEKATKGPWAPSAMLDMGWPDLFDILPETNQRFPLMVRAEMHDAQFVAAARSDVPRLVAEVRALREHVQELRDERRTAWPRFIRALMESRDVSDPLRPVSIAELLFLEKNPLPVARAALEDGRHE